MRILQSPLCHFGGGKRVQTSQMPVTCFDSFRKSKRKKTTTGSYVTCQQHKNLGQ